MHKQTLLFIACILSGFMLAHLPVSSVISAGIANFFKIVGGLTIIVFSVAIVYLGVKSLIGK